jgi:hypothetical protein
MRMVGDVVNLTSDSSPLTTAASMVCVCVRARLIACLLLELSVGLGTCGCGTGDLASTYELL